MSEKTTPENEDISSLTENIGQESLDLTDEPTNESNSIASSSVGNDHDGIRSQETEASLETETETSEMQAIKEGIESIIEERDYSKKNEKTELLHKAHNLQCPFVWQNLSCITYGDHDIDMVTDCDEMFDETGFKFRRFVVQTIYCYRNFYKRLGEEATKNLQELDSMLSISSKRENHDYLFNRINDALFHVAHALRVYILHQTNQMQKAAMIIRKIKSYESMDKANQAGIWAIRANIFVEYGYEGVKSAVGYINKAIELDSENPYWHFMRGMYLGRVRRTEDGLAIPSSEELNSLMSAIRLLKDGSFYAFAGEVYLETAVRAKKQFNVRGMDPEGSKMLDTKLDKFNSLAATYFKTSVDLKPNCAHLMFRCGKGLMKLPPPHQNLELAYKFFKRGLEISPKSSYGNHAMAMYLIKIEKNPQKAKKNLNVAINRKNFPAHLDMVRVKFIETGDVLDSIEDLREMLATYTELPKRRRILGEIICIFLFLEYDLPEACSALKELITINTKTCRILKEFQSQILPISTHVPLLDVVLGQIKIELSRKNRKPMEVEIYKQFIQICIDEDYITDSLKGRKFDRINKEVRKAIQDRETEQEKIKIKNNRLEKKRNPINCSRNNDNEYLKQYRQSKKRTHSYNDEVRQLQSLISQQRAGRHDIDDNGKKRGHGDRRRSRRERSMSQSYSDGTTSSTTSSSSYESSQSSESSESDHYSRRKHRKGHHKKSHRGRFTSRSRSRGRKSERHSSRGTSDSRRRYRRCNSRDYENTSRKNRKTHHRKISSSEDSASDRKSYRRRRTLSYSHSSSSSLSSVGKHRKESPPDSDTKHSEKLSEKNELKATFRKMTIADECAESTPNCDGNGKNVPETKEKQSSCERKKMTARRAKKTSDESESDVEKLDSDCSETSSSEYEKEKRREPSRYERNSDRQYNERDRNHKYDRHERPSSVLSQSSRKSHRK